MTIEKYRENLIDFINNQIKSAKHCLKSCESCHDDLGINSNTGYIMACQYILNEVKNGRY